MESLSSLFHTETGFWIILGRLTAAALLGCVIGIDREYLARPAGLRTHILVALAAATFAVLTFELMTIAAAHGRMGDPIRVIEAVTAGVAFLAAGTIIMARGEVHGLTTGAGLWLAGAVGTACGIGAYSIAALATALGFVVLTVLRIAERHLPKKEGKPRGRPKEKDSVAKPGNV